MFESFFVVEFECALLADADLYQCVFLFVVLCVAEVHFVDVLDWIGAGYFSAGFFAFETKHFLLCAPTTADLALFEALQVDQCVLFVQFLVIFFS